MNRQETLNIMLEGIVQDMGDLYTRSGVSEEDKKSYLSQANESFKILCTGMYDRLLELGVIKDA